MNEDQLKTIALRLNLDLFILKRLAQKFNIKKEDDLVRRVNEVKALQQETGEQDLGKAIDFYVEQEKKKTEKLETAEITQTPTLPDQPQRPTETPETKPPETLEGVKPPPTAPTQPEQPTTQTQPTQPGSINFDAKYANGFQFRPKSADDLTGQCAWYSEQITRMGDGSTWTIGNTVGDKKSQFAGHKSKGNAFSPGEEQVQPGQSIILDTGTKWGHVATVSEVMPDGKVRLTESNWDNDQKVRNDRIIDPRGKDVIGILKTRPTAEFQAGGAITPPGTPETTEKLQGDIDNAAGGKQELPEQEQEIKPEDLKVGNTNVTKALNEGFSEQELFTVAQKNEKQPSETQKGILESVEEIKAGVGEALGGFAEGAKELFGGREEETPQKAFEQEQKGIAKVGEEQVKEQLQGIKPVEKPGLLNVFAGQPASPSAQFQKFSEQLAPQIGTGALPSQEAQVAQNVQQGNVLFTPAVAQAQDLARQVAQRFQDPIQATQSKMMNTASQVAQAAQRAITENVSKALQKKAEEAAAAQRVLSSTSKRAVTAAKQRPSPKPAPRQSTPSRSVSRTPSRTPSRPAPKASYRAPTRSYTPSRSYTPARTYTPAPSRSYTPARRYTPAPKRSYSPIKRAVSSVKKFFSRWF